MKYYQKGNDLVLIIDEVFDHQDLTALFHHFHFSKKAIHLLHQYKGYKINNEYKLNATLHKGDVVVLKAYDKDDGTYVPNFGPIEVAYEDELLLIVNKPANLPVYPSDLTNHNSLAHRVAGYYLMQGYDLPVRFIHRLDDETSGLVVFVKSTLFLPLFDYLLSIKEIKRTYLAFVEGSFKDTTTHKIETYLAKDRHNAKRMRVSDKGQKAITYYKCLANYDHYALVSCSLETGRRHQIRVHMAFIGHPLLGDPLYNTHQSQIKRQALHACAIEMIHPLTNEQLVVRCDLPSDLQSLITSPHS
jgi:23S rRNA pseudouridine1911/1915/1917 synthase